MIVNALLPKGCPKFEPEDIQACHRRQGKYTRETVLFKLIWRGDVREVLNKRKLLRDMDLSTIDPRLTSPVYINEHLTAYYSKLRYACKQLKSAKLLDSFWISGHKVKAKLVPDGEINIISHKDDFSELLPETDLRPYFSKIKIF